jgi:hypothetical protein
MEKLFTSASYWTTHLVIGKFLEIISFLNGVRSLFYPNKTYIQVPYNGEKILIIALFEKGILRTDIEGLLLKAKAKGLYVIAINTQKLLGPKNFTNFFDVYIERYNFGRDFGSYKTAFKFLYKHQYHKVCPRVIMLNDSVFYESTRTGKFLDDLINPSIEVLGATENFEIQHHLGSFCISIAGRVLRHKRLRKYWRRYRNSDVRPTVIKRGEMNLSRCLQKTVKSPEDMAALYSMTTIAAKLMEDSKAVSEAAQFLRRSNYVWGQLSLPHMWMAFVEQYYVSNLDRALGKKVLLKLNDILPYYALHNLDQMHKFFKERLNIEDKNLLSNMKRYAVANIMWAARQGSQIHQSNVMLLHLGLPIIKLDAFFRGPMNEEDALLLYSLMLEEEAKTLCRLLFIKSHGRDVLFGWKRMLFDHGFL